MALLPVMQCWRARNLVNMILRNHMAMHESNGLLQTKKGRSTGEIK